MQSTYRRNPYRPPDAVLATHHVMESWGLNLEQEVIKRAVHSRNIRETMKYI